MKQLFAWKKTLAALCVLALLVSVLPGAALAEEEIDIPDVYVNGDSKVVTAAGELSVVLRLTVENPGRIHILSSGVDVSMVLFDEGADAVVDVYSSENGLMDVPFDANPGTYLIGLTGEGEVELLVADEDRTGEIYSAEEVVTESADESSSVPSETDEALPAESSSNPAETSESSDNEASQVEEGTAEQPVTEEVAPAAPSYDPSVPVHYQAELEETISVLDVLHAAGAKVEAVTYVSGDMEGRVFSSASNVVLGDWLLTPYMPFDSIELSVKTFEDVTYTLILSCPSQEQEDESAAAITDVPAETPAEGSAPAENSAPADGDASSDVPPVTDVTAPEADAAPEETTASSSESSPSEDETEAPAVTDETAPDEAAEPAPEAAEQPEENGENKKGFISGFVDFLFGSSSSKKEGTEETAEEAVDETEENPADETESTEETADETESAEDSAEAPAEDLTEDSTEAPANETESTEESADETAPADEAEATEESSDEAEPDDEPADEAAPADEAEATEESSDAESEVLPEELPVFDPSAPIEYRAETNEIVSVLSVLTEAGAQVNIVKNVTGDMDGKIFSSGSNTDGDWRLTPFAYFDSVELTVTAADYLAEDPAAAETEFTVILSNPDPDAQEEPAEPAEDAADETPEDEAPEDKAPADEAAPAMEVSIAVERGEDNAIRLFAENITEEEKDSYAYQWQYSLDNEEWHDVEGAVDKDYNFVLDETNGLYYWRLIVSYK